MIQYRHTDTKKKLGRLKGFADRVLYMYCMYRLYYVVVSNCIRDMVIQLLVDKKKDRDESGIKDSREIRTQNTE